ncbi:MAG: hypothetical protein AAGA69_01595 [Pseudomonadota bacterium]
MVSDRKTLPLHILSRVHAKQNLGYGGIKNLAQRAAERVAPDGDVDNAYKLIKAFLDSGTPIRGEAEEALVDELRSDFANAPNGSQPSLGSVLETVVSDDMELGREELVSFFAPYERTELVAKNLRSETIEALFDGPSADFAALDNAKHISQALALAGLMFDRSSDDVTPVDTRFSEKKHFSFIRRSTADLEALVVHGLKFEPHAERPGYTYFSEKYERHDETGEAIGSRESNGVAFFDQNHVYGITRTSHRPTLSNFVGHRPGDDDFFWFDGMLTTSNSIGARISARGLCLWHDNEDDKRALTGMRTPDDIFAAFSSDRARGAVEKWLADDERQTAIVL